MTDRSRRLYLIYLALLSALGAAAVLMATAKIGPGVSTDGAMMLSTAENLAAGRGLVDYRGQPLTQFAPLYPVVLALGSLVFGREPFLIGWALGALIFGLIIWSGGIYFARVFGADRLPAYLATFVLFSSPSLVQISSNILSDPLFLLMAIWFLIGMSAYARQPDDRRLAALAALTIAACFERYAGLALVFSGTLVVAYAGRARPRLAALRAFVFLVASGLPILLWGLLHNQPVQGYAFGSRLPSIPLLNLTAGAAKLLYWFMPFRIISLIGPLPLFGLVLAALAAAAAAGGAASLRGLLRPAIFPSLALLGVYSAVLVFDISSYELLGLDSDRVHVILLPPLLATVGTLLAPLQHRLRDRAGPRPAYVVTMLLFALWAVYPLARTDEYVRRSMEAGDVSAYNSINKGDIRSSALARFLRGLDLRGMKVYSNGGDSAWFIMHARISPMPMPGAGDHLTRLAQQYAGWPGPAGEGYLVWFRSEAYKEAYATPQELGAIADVQLIYSSPQGAVYRVSAR